MPVTYPDRRVLPVAQLLMGCLSQEALLNPKPPQVVGFRTGTEGQPLAGTSADECCMGAAFVRVIRTFPSWSAPTPSNLSVSCAQPMAAEFELSMWRCAPMGTLQIPPSQALWDELNTDLLNDRATIMAAVCCFIGQRDAKSVMYGDWQAVATEGGCAGSTMSVLADLYGRNV
jgi:hypothetical protein